MEAPARQSDSNSKLARQMFPGPRPDPQQAGMRERLAAIDRMRDQALERGDVQALLEADRMEHQVRVHYNNGRADKPAAVQADATLEQQGFVGPGYGRMTAEEARTLGREFGQAVSQQRQSAAASEAPLLRRLPPTPDNPPRQPATP
jgi:hypothetical protein